MLIVSALKSGRRIWHRITQPAGNIEYEELRQQAGLAVALIATLVVGVLIFAPLWLVANPEHTLAPVLSVALILAFAIAYGLSRSEHHEVGKAIAVMALPIFVVVALLTAPGPILNRLPVLNLLVIATMLTNIFFGVRATMLIMGLNVMGIAAFLFVPDVPHVAPLAYIIVVTMIAVFLVTVGTFVEKSARRLHESEQRYRSLFEQSNDAVFILDLNGVHLKANHRATEMMGYTLDEIVGRPFWDLIAPAEQAKSHDIWKELLAGQQIAPYERIFRKQDGTEFAAEVNVELVRSETGQPVHIQRIVRDISERKQTEQALREREEYLRTIIRNAPSGMHFYQMAEDGRLVLESANPAADQILGIDHRELTGKAIEEAFPGLIETEIPASYKRIADHDATLDGREVPYYQGEINGVFEIQAFHTLPGRMAVFFADITERKRAEQQALALAVEKERINILKQFVQNASHEFRTPLSTINTSVYLMTKTDDEAERLKTAGIAREQTQRLTKLLDMVNQLVRLDSGVTFAFVSTDINTLLRQIINRAQADLNKKALSVHFELDAPQLVACVDVDWLEEAFQSLLDNAIRFTPDHGSIMVHLHRRGKDVIIEIRDTGIGISPEALPHIFERFWRQDEAHTTPGFGLGLCIAQKVVEQHGGKIEVESCEGAGSAFRVILPIEAKSCQKNLDILLRPQPGQPRTNDDLRDFRALGASTKP